MNKETVLAALKEMDDKSKERKFVQSIDLAINLKGIDFKKTENRLELDILLPNPLAKEKKALAFVKDKTFASDLKDVVQRIVLESELATLNKKDAKKISNEFDVFVAEGSAMVSVGKYLGQILSPKGKMPKPVPTDVKAVEKIVDGMKRSIKVSNKKGRNLPVVHAIVGNEKMEKDRLAENILTVYNSVLTKVGNEQNIKSIFVKKSMGPAIKISDEKEKVNKQ